MEKLTKIYDILKRNSECYPHKEYIRSYYKEKYVESITFSDIYQSVTFGRNYLNGILKLQPEDKVVLIGDNTIAMAVSMLSVICSGAVCVPVNYRENNLRINAVIEETKPKCILVSRNFEKRIHAQGTWKKEYKLIYFDEFICSAETYNLENDFDKKLDDAEQTSLIIYSSGTTGYSKGVMLTQKNILTDAFCLTKANNVNNLDIIMCVLPLFHVNGFVFTLLTSLLNGCTLILNELLYAPKVMQIIQDEKVNLISVVPQILIMWLKMVDPEKYDLSSLRHIVSSAAPLSPATAKAFYEKFKIRIIHGYGLSETSCFSTLMPLDLSEEKYIYWMHEFKWSSIGVSMYETEVKVVDADGNELGPDEEGEIVVKGDAVTSGYFLYGKNDEIFFNKEWFRTGDRGIYKEDDENRRFYFVTGRIKEVANRAGEKISLYEIDNVLLRIPGIKDAVAVGFPDENLGEEIGAVVVLHEDETLSLSELQQFCLKYLAKFKIPRQLRLIDELPKTATGKTQRMKLKTLFQTKRD